MPSPSPAQVKMDPASILGTPGFFRVGRSVTGRWWLLDPRGQPFFHCGVCAINRAGTAGGRLAKPGPYAEVVDAKYHYPAGPQRFVDETLARLRRWNFNALGSWCTDEFFDQGMPYTDILEFNKLVPGIKVAGVNVPDVFDPAWLRAIDEQAGRLCPPRRGKTQLIGYFTDNELGWGQLDTDAMWGAAELVNRKGPTLLQACMGLPPEKPAHVAAWEFALGRHGQSLRQLASDWGASFATVEEFRQLTEQGTILITPGYGVDQDVFSRDFARRYFQHAAEAVRRHDPDHLILGCRFGAPPGANILSQCRSPWVDVLSANNYRTTFYERLDTYHLPQQMPVLIGEFSWASPPFTDPQLMTEAQRQRPVADHVRDTALAVMERAATHRGFVGYTWYRWVQNRNADGFSYGLVDRQDQEIAFNTELVTLVNARVQAVAART